jgi:hypothetical protein
MRYLSKGRYLSSLQCDKKLWIEANARELVPALDPAELDRLEQGRVVGEIARGLHPGGVSVGRHDLAWEPAILATQEALMRRVPLYEAAFAHGGAACRVDLLVPAGGAAWDLLEVKSSTKVEDEDREDLAFQTWVLRGAGVELRRQAIVRIDSSYERSGDLEIERLFVVEDQTEAIEPVVTSMPTRVDAALRAARSPSQPTVEIGPHCTKPRACPLEELCWRHLPEQSVLALVNGGKKRWDLYQRGVRGLQEIPAGTALTARQSRQVEAARDGRPRFDPSALRQFLAALAYPLHFLDFEALAPAVPPFDRTRPYQQLPFQFSLCVVREPGAERRMHSFLTEGGGDPRPLLFARLREAIGPAGSIVVYNEVFEMGVLREGGEALPEYRAWSEAVIERVVDLYRPFRSLDYYHPAQRGSVSMKSVLPALVGRGYAELEIQEGTSAAREFLRSLASATPPEERERIRRALIAYCDQDATGMADIVEALTQIAGQGT